MHRIVGIMIALTMMLMAVNKSKVADMNTYIDLEPLCFNARAVQCNSYIDIFNVNAAFKFQCVRDAQNWWITREESQVNQESEIETSVLSLPIHWVCEG